MIAKRCGQAILIGSLTLLSSATIYAQTFLQRLEVIESNIKHDLKESRKMSFHGALKVLDHDARRAMRANKQVKKKLKANKKEVKKIISIVKGVSLLGRNYSANRNAGHLAVDPRVDKFYRIIGAGQNQYRALTLLLSSKIQTGMDGLFIDQKSTAHLFESEFLSKSRSYLQGLNAAASPAGQAQSAPATQGSQQVKADKPQQTGSQTAPAQLTTAPQGRVKPVGAERRAETTTATPPAARVVAVPAERRVETATRKPAEVTPAPVLTQEIDDQTIQTEDDSTTTTDSSASDSSDSQSYPDVEY